MQHLPRSLALMALDVERFMRQNLDFNPEGAKLLLALSAGVDSTALISLFSLLRPRLKLSLFAAHLDHALRPESFQEAQHVHKLCQSLEVPCLSLRVDVALAARENKEGLETAGRRARYVFLEKCRSECGASHIVCAHHAHDLAEDILLRLTRGSGWPALGGMPARDDARKLLRPLLMLEKQSLIELVQACGLDWCEDASNQDRTYKRNRMRLDVLPLLHQENPALVDGMKNIWRMARVDEDFWQNLLAPTLAKALPSKLLPQNELEALPQAARLRLYRALVQSFPQAQAQAEGLFALDKAFTVKSRGKVFFFPGAVQAQVLPVGVKFSQNSPTPS